MNYWLITDTHFNHAKIEQWGDRSGSWQQQLWNGLYVIPDTDVLIHLGDVCIGNDDQVNLAISTTPPRKKILVLGNHDKRSKEWYYEHGWDFVCDGFELCYQGHCLWLSHRPQPPMGQFTNNIHGHTHGNLHRAEEYASFYDPSYHVDMSPELVGFEPLRLDTLLPPFRG